FPTEDGDRPAVADDVVEDDRQHVLVFVELHQQRAQQCVLAQREAPPRLRAYNPSRYVLPPLTDLTEVYDREREPGLRRDDLNGAAVHLDEARTQHLMPPHDLADRP